jgi:dephospho-CoA kinase
MLKVGITGGIGTGKSEVCRILEKLGSVIIYADDLAKEILDTDESIKQKVRKTFGEDIYSSDGKLNRKKMARLIFLDESLKVNLEKIVHPVVIQKIIDKFEQLDKSNKQKLAFLEAALIYETGLDEVLDYVIVVDAAEDVCIKRVMQRDNVGKDEVVLRIKAQMPAAEKVGLADFVIHNNNEQRQLETNVKFFHNLLNQMAKS